MGDMDWLFIGVLYWLRCCCCFHGYGLYDLCFLFDYCYTRIYYDYQYQMMKYLYMYLLFPNTVKTHMATIISGWTTSTGIKTFFISIAPNDYLSVLIYVTNNAV